MKLKAAIFDLDGIIADTEGFQYEGWVEALKPYGAKLGEDEYKRNYAGNTGIYIEADLIKSRGLIAKAGSILAEKEQFVFEWFSEGKIKLMPYVAEAVDYFLKKGLKTAIASGGPRGEVRLKLKRLGLLDKFEAIATKDDVSMSKPHPDVYLFAAKTLGVKPAHCAAFEDTMYGVQSAKGAGMFCIAIPTEFSENQDFSMADARLSSLKEAISYLGKKGMV
jgi:beta-phosphoglucomutase